MALAPYRKKILIWSRRYPWVYALAAIFLTYWRLPFTYFEQDEWQAFETYINTTNQPLTNCFQVQRPLTCMVNTVEWHLFGTDPVGYGLFSLVLILTIGYLFYRLLRRLEIQPYKAAISTALFPYFAAGNQAIVWFGAFSASLPSFLFAVLALDYFYQYVRQPSRKLMAFVLGSTLISLYFKEDTLWLFPVFLVVWLVYRPKQKLIRSGINFLTNMGPPIVIGLIYLYLERWRQLHNPVFSSLISTTDTVAYLQAVGRSLFLLPLTHLSQVILTPDYAINLSNAWGLSVTAYSGFTSAIVIIYFVYLVLKTEKKARAPLYVFIAWALTGFIAYAVFGKNPETLEGRYYFATQAPAVTLLVVGLLPQKWRSLTSRRALAVAILIIIVSVNAVIATTRMGLSLKTAAERRNIISFIQEKAPTLPAKAVIYTETTNYGYVGQAAAIMPFQNGLGTTLRVVYQDKNQDYRALSKKQGYLWNLLNQGYDEDKGIGFGYFREYNKLKTAVLVNHIPIDNIFAFRYIGTKISDITDSVRTHMHIESEGVNEEPHGNWKISSSNDAGIDEKHGLGKVLDGDSWSDWSVPHRQGAYVELDLGRPVANLTQIALVTADGNSYPRAVRIDYSSKDKGNWEGSSDDIGTIDDYRRTVFIFPAHTIRRFRVTITDPQLLFFNWSLSDINIYTSKAK